MIENILNRKDSVSIFGRGMLFEQISPMLNEVEITVVDVFDDIENPLNVYNIPILYLVGYKNMKRRGERFDELLDLGYSMMSFAANNAILSKHISVGCGTIIHQGAIVDNYVDIGRCVFINIGASISHNCIIKQNVYISPQAALSGFVTVESDTFIGTNATIIDGIRVGEGAVVAAGAVVIKDVPPYTMVAGCPATIKRIL